MRKFRKIENKTVENLYSNQYLYGLFNPVANELCGQLFFANNDNHAIQKIEMDLKRTPFDIDLQLFRYGTYSTEMNHVFTTTTPIMIWTNVIEDEEEKK